MQKDISLNQEITHNLSKCELIKKNWESPTITQWQTDSHLNNGPRSANDATFAS